MRARARESAPIRRLAIAAALVLAAFAVVLPARAAEIPRLQGPVTDQTGVLDDRTREIEDALDALLAGHGVQLFVLFVGTTDDLTAADFAHDTARANSLGVNDALLLVALDDRTDYVWLSDGLDEITDAELDEIIGGTLEPRLAAGDFAGAVVATAGALGAAAVEVPQPTPSSGGGNTGGTDAASFLGILLFGAGIVVLGVWLAARVSRGLAERREADERDRRTGRLARDANGLLITIDERARTATDEADFVEAEFGPDQAAPFRDAIAAAREELRAAFAIRQRLDDAEPEDPPTRERLLTEIVERCQRAGAALDAQAARIRELRDLERNAPQVLASLPAQVQAQEARLGPAEATLDRLRSYAPGAWQPIDGNVVEARKGLAGARAALERAAVVPAPGGRSLVRAILVAQEGITGARALIDAVEAQAANVRDAEAGLPGELREAGADLSAARQALERQPGMHITADGPDLAAVEEALGAARASAAISPRDPVAAHRSAIAARRDAAALLAAVKGASEDHARLVAALDTALAAAEADRRRAADFIATRRHGVGRRARTRLAEAERALAQAGQARESDPRAGIEAARRAERLAEEAYALAARDFGRVDAGGRSPTAGGSDLAGAILGGIIGGILSGSGRGGGWGGSGWGSPGSSGGRGGGIGWGAGRGRGGSFGGFGGGGRGRGGRW